MNNTQSTEGIGITRRRFLRITAGAVASVLLAGLKHKYPKQVLAQTIPTYEIEESEKERIKILVQQYITPIMNKNVNDPLFGEISEESSKLRKTSDLQIEYSHPLNRIPSEIRFLNKRGFKIDFATVKGFEEIKNEKDLKIKMLKIIRFLSVQSQEEIRASQKKFKQLNQDDVIKKYFLMETLEELKNLYAVGPTKDEFRSLWVKLFPSHGDVLGNPVELHKYMDRFRELIYEYQSEIFSYINSENNATGVEAWNQVYSCNIYASSVIACLGLQDKFSRRVDKDGNPVVRNVSRDIIYVKGKESVPKGRIKELSANDIYNWLEDKGAQYGWIDVTDLSYQEKVKYLEEGHIMYGTEYTPGDSGHNWIIFGGEVDGKTVPLLTQATYNTLLAPFVPEDLIGMEMSAEEGMPLSVRRNSEFYQASYKLMPRYFDTEQVKIYAIKPKL